jgi:S-DNA-T family DNA segregation ATPase FtsK/SpoIIIE
VQVVLVGRGGRRELDVRVNNPAATVADLVEALDPEPPSGSGAAGRELVIGDQVADPDFELGEAGLHEGAVIRLEEAGAPGAGPVAWPAPPAPERELAVVNGLNAGRRFALTPGTTDIGRSRTCKVALGDGTISKRHAILELDDDGGITVEDLGSHNGTWIDGEPVVDPSPLEEGANLRLGALDLKVRPVRDDDRSVAVDPRRFVNAAGTIPFNRPPRPASAPPPEQITPPKPAQTGQGKVPLGLIGIITPLLFAGIMFLVLKNAQFLLFAGLTPVMGIATAVDSKRRGRKTERSEKDRFRREMGEFRGKLVATIDDERRRLEGLYPDPAEILRRVTLPSTTVWERRPTHADFLQLRAGVGDVPWTPPTGDLGRRAELPDELREALEESAVIPGAPMPVDLSEGGVVGIVGDRTAALALARSLICQAAVLSGPADLPVMVLTNPEAAFEWDWAKWLPHTRDATGAGRMLSDHPDLSTAMVEARLKAAESQDRFARPEPSSARQVGPTLLAVVDDEKLTEGRKAPTRSLLRGEAGLVAGIVIASRAERLPALCTTVIDMTDPDGPASLTLPQKGLHIPEFMAAGMADDVARECARLMARFEDPELDIVGAGLPASIRLLPLLDLEHCSAEAVLARWKAGGVDPRPAGPVGVTEKGIFSIDFVADGPHGLVGGTTGAGKSELLRTMVAGLAASVDPDHLTFVLVDFKGGSAFDECAKLPHTVGMVTDLDEHLAERALRCLEAELKYRERMLRAAAAIDLPDYLRNNPGSEPLPRLLVIIDEFATLKAELPDFIDALVGVAQRGRSLGVHMLLATQRPQGAISENIKANTNLRIALRVQDKTDSVDVIAVPDAANIPRNAPGRAYVRLGPNEVVAMQSALSTGARDEASQVHVDLAPFVYGPDPRAPEPPPPADADAAGLAGLDGLGAAAPVAETDLSVLVAAIDEAFAATGRPKPRRPWPEPLPGEVDLDGVIELARAAADPGEPPGFVPFAMADDPEAQTQYPVGWVPEDGNLLLCGIGGSGTTTALSSLALSLARLHDPDDLHIYVLDFGAGELAALEPVPHVGAVIQAGERERQTRLVRHLRAELDRRRELGAAAVRREPTIVVLIDGWSAMAAEYGDYTSESVLELFSRVFADGPEVGLLTVIGADRASAVPMRLASLVRQRFALRLADLADYSMFGVRSSAVPKMVPGRAIVGGTGQVIQVARPRAGVAAAAVRSAGGGSTLQRPPVRIATLATQVSPDELGRGAQLEQRPWTIPVGIAERTLDTAELVAYQGEHVLICGPARSGRSSVLRLMAGLCRQARDDLTVIAVAGPRSPLPTEPLVDATVAPSTVGEALMPLVDGASGAVLVLVDDAEAVEDSGGVMERLGTIDRPGLLVVAAGRNDGIRTGYSHWTRALRRSKLGILLRPDVDLDGDILGTKLPRRAPVAMVAGRGYLINSGDVPELIQLAEPR